MLLFPVCRRRLMLLSPRMRLAPPSYDFLDERRTRGHTHTPFANNDVPFIDDFIARSSDELSLVKGDRVELIERDDEFGDGWFLGKHLVNGNSGLFPEGWSSSQSNYTRPLLPTNKPASLHPTSAPDRARPCPE